MQIKACGLSSEPAMLVGGMTSAIGPSCQNLTQPNPNVAWLHTGILTGMYLQKRSHNFF